MSEELLKVNKLNVEFTTKHGTVHALRDVNYYINPGEIVGIVGESGSGKSVGMMALLGLLSSNGKVTEGSIVFDGQEISSAGIDSKTARREHEKMMMNIRGKDISVIFQDPMTYLNPVLKIGTQMTEGIRRHMGLGKKDAEARAIEMLKKVGIPNPEKRMHQYPYEFSGGMRQRIIIAIALSCTPKLLIADEPTTALDVTVQAQILSLIKESAQSMNAAAIVITHDLGVVAELCHRIMIMYGGKIVEQGTAEEIFYNPQHPYTKGLLMSVGALGKVQPHTELPSIPGAPPNLLGLNSGCAFMTRCEEAMKICKDYMPADTEFSETHICSCWKYCKEKAAEIVAAQSDNAVDTDEASETSAADNADIGAVKMANVREGVDVDETEAQDGR